MSKLSRLRKSKRYAACADDVAGMAGLEPANAGVKVPCLTTWLHPNRECGEGRSGRSGPQPQCGVGNGARTHDTRNHNPVLCQLSYTHHMQLIANGTALGIPAKPRHRLRGGRRGKGAGRAFGAAGSEGYGACPDAVARLKGLEPLTHCLEGSCSIHLSYRRV